MRKPDVRLQRFISKEATRLKQAFYNRFFGACKCDRDNVEFTSDHMENILQKICHDKRDILEMQVD